MGGKPELVVTEPAAWPWRCSQTQLLIGGGGGAVNRLSLATTVPLRSVGLIRVGGGVT